MFLITKLLNIHSTFAMVSSSSSSLPKRTTSVVVITVFGSDVAEIEIIQGEFSLKKNLLAFCMSVNCGAKPRSNAY